MVRKLVIKSSKVLTGKIILLRFFHAPEQSAAGKIVNVSEQVESCSTVVVVPYFRGNQLH